MSQQSRFLRPLSPEGPYRFNPHRALSPRVLAAPSFLRMLHNEVALSEAETQSFRKCLDQLTLLYPEVKTGYMERKIMLRECFIIDTIWSHTPHAPDIFVVTGPGDVGFFGIGFQYGQTGDEALFDKLTPISLPFLN